MTIRELLNRKGSKVITMLQDSSVLDAVRTMVEVNVGSVVVVDDKDYPVGIFTERDVMKRFVDNCEGIRSQRLGDTMTADLIICTPERNIEEVMNIMTEKRLRHLPILEDQRVVGMVSIGDIVKANLKKTRFEIQYLQDYISGKF